MNKDILEVVNQLRARGSGGAITAEVTPAMFDAWANTLEQAVEDLARTLQSAGRLVRFDGIVSDALDANCTPGDSLASEDENEN